GGRARGHACRCRNPADGSGTSADVARRLRPRAGSTSSRAGPSSEPVENVPPVGVGARQVERQAVPLEVYGDPARPVGTGDRKVAAVGVEAVGIAQPLLGPVLFRHGDMTEWSVREIDG